jgi:hypothetical protein
MRHGDGSAATPRCPGCRQRPSHTKVVDSGGVIWCFLCARRALTEHRLNCRGRALLQQAGWEKLRDWPCPDPGAEER